MLIVIYLALDPGPVLFPDGDRDPGPTGTGGNDPPRLVDEIRDLEPGGGQTLFFIDAKRLWLQIQVERLVLLKQLAIQCFLG